MSTCASFVDQQSSSDAFQSVRSNTLSNDAEAWLIVGHVDNNSSLLDVIDCSIDADSKIDDRFMSHFQAHSTLFTKNLHHTPSYVYTSADNISRLGEDVPFIRRARFGVVHGSIAEMFSPNHCFVETSSSDDLTKEALVNRLNEASGTVNHVLETRSGHQLRGFTAHSASNASQKQAPRNIAPSALDFQITDELRSSIAAVRSDSSPQSWVLAAVHDVRRPLTLVSSGCGEFATEATHLLDDQRVMYALLRVTDTLDNIATVKFVYVYWIGENTKPMIKGKVSAIAATIQEYFSPFHVSISASQSGELSSSIIDDMVWHGNWHNKSLPRLK